MRRIFFQTQGFSRKIGSDDFLLRRIEAAILKNPEAGDLVQGTGGVRKLRIEDPTRQKGKRGGFRVLYLDLPTYEKTFLIVFYSKNEADDLSPQAKKQVTHLVAEIKKGS
jgi:hypothetical protein